MGQKINPHGYRVGIIKDWNTKWYAEKDKYAAYLKEDHMIREHIKERHKKDGISKVEIERTAKEDIRITIHTSRPGMVIGKGGSFIDALIKNLENIIRRYRIKTEKDQDRVERLKKNKEKLVIRVNIVEVKKIDLDAQLVSENIAQQLEGRVAFRRAMKQAMNRVMKAQALGVKVAVSGMLGGADMARTEHYQEGTIPLQTLRADIDYGFAEAYTTFGLLGVKVWIYKGEVLPGQEEDKKGAKQNVNAKKSKKA